MVSPKSSKSSASPPLLAGFGLTKSFGDFTANRDIDFTIYPGELHALLGENGAGKSTFVKMIYGLLQPDSGYFEWQGKPIHFSNPQEARAAGIGMVFQHFSLFEAMSVVENIALALPPEFPKEGLPKLIEQKSAEYGIPLRPHSLVADLSIPVHGTARHLLAHAELAENCQVAQTLIPENGDVVKFNAGKAEIEGQAHTGLLTHEGGEIVDLQSDFLRVRRRMLWNGTVTISVVLSGAGHLLMAPQISQSGLCSDQQEDDFIADASLAVEDALVQHSEQPKRDNRTYEQIVTGAVRSLAKQRFRLRPTVHAHILQASDEELRA